MRFTRHLQIVFFLAVVFTLFMALNPHPPALYIDRYGDKFEHMGAFAVLAGLARFAFPKAGYLRILERLSFFGALIEVFQAIPSLHRDCDWADWVADSASAAASLGLLYLALKYWHNRQAAA